MKKNINNIQKEFTYILYYITNVTNCKLLLLIVKVYFYIYCGIIGIDKRTKGAIK